MKPLAPRQSSSFACSANTPSPLSRAHITDGSYYRHMHTTPMPRVSARPLFEPYQLDITTLPPFSDSRLHHCFHYFLHLPAAIYWSESSLRFSFAGQRQRRY
jgi:hypothetical protein